MAADFLGNLMEARGVLVVAKDNEGHYLQVNEQFLRAFGDLAKQPGDVTDEAIFSPQLSARFRHHDVVALQGGGASVHEERVVTRQGECNFLFTHFPFTDSRGRNCIAMMGFDISGRAMGDEDLLSRPLFKEILKIAADAIISIDEEQRIVLFNQGAERIFGYTAEEIVGQPLTLLLPPASRPAHEGHVEQFGHSGGRPRQMGERGAIAGRRKDGSIFPAEASISRVQMAGRVTYTAILRDTTEARRAEQSIKALNADLERRAAQLEHANRELEAFSYSVSHDLRAPLRSIDGFSQLLLEDFYATLPDEAQDSLQRIRAASQRMAQLIDDMLALSRVTRASISRQDVDLTVMAKSVVEELHNSQPDREVTFDIAEGLVCHADPHLIHIVLNNLLSNAWKYTSKHETARITFDRKVEPGGRTIYFVKDDGAGFDMAYANKLFGVFQRLHAMNDYAGTGVGLATVQRIVHKHGGEVWAEAAIERGATFYFTLN
jgi:PAS domain S-box-containing protein